MSNKNKKNDKKPGGFNLTWLYVIVAAILGYLVLQKGDSVIPESGQKVVTYSQFKDYVAKGYASRIEANKKQGSLRMFVCKEHIRDVFKTTNTPDGTHPFVETEFPSTDKLEDFVVAQQTEGNFKGEVVYEQGDDTWVSLLISFGPLIFFVLLWIFIMRRMGGGNGNNNGPMGIFNVGKSRAT
ncbi:MAG: ATP-dependent metallopeptidase FtsH/Yme1/Tma family protein, partial [Bacteroidaceae bacterium]|nr:ATP-dependent metallopeptidase FtsH/Yme1/Tma family protein [Bacteroidaceae bacterium]